MRRTSWVYTLVFVAAACSSGTGVGRYISARLAAAPQEAPLCYVGTANLLADSLAPPPQSYERRWLVLDTTRVAEAPGYTVAYVITPKGHESPIFAQWRRVGDSIEVHELNELAPASWVLGVQRDTLVGRGLMIHDVVYTDSAGRVVPRRSNWRARAYRIPCRQVP